MSHIVSIGSFRRGVGKSSISASLAVHAAKMGWRVGLAELNYLFPSSQKYLFDLPEPTVSLMDYLRERAEIGAVGVNALAGQDAGAELWVFPWGDLPLLGDVDAIRLSSGLQILRKQHQLDLLLLDLGVEFPDFNLLMASITDCMMIVMRPDQMDYQGTAVMVDVARTIGIPDIRLIVNQVTARHDIAQVRGQVEAAYGVPASVLPFAEDLLGGGLADPHHPWSQAVRSVADNLFPALTGRKPEPLATNS